MPCDSRKEPQREEQIVTALRRLETALSSGQATVTIGRNGALAFTGWTTEQRDGMQDLCAYRRLLAENSWPLRLAIQRAEAMAGRTLDRQAIAAGMHSHDGGKTWGSH